MGIAMENIITIATTLQYMQQIQGLENKGVELVFKSKRITDKAADLLIKAASVIKEDDDLLRIIDWIARNGGDKAMQGAHTKELTAEISRFKNMSAAQLRKSIRARESQIFGKQTNGSTREMVDEMNLHHANTMMGGKNMIFRERIDPENPKILLTEFIRPKELMGVYMNELYESGQTAEGKPIISDKITAWMKHENCRRYVNGVHFLPFNPKEEAPEIDGMLNLWTGFAVEPEEGDWGLIDWHIKNVLAGGDSSVYEYILNWCARSVQQPEKQAGTVLVFRGTNRIGKGIFAHFIKNIFGRHSFYTAQSKHITGNFNAALAQTCLLYADEAFFAGDKQQANILKSIVTDPVFPIEKKGHDAINMANRLKIIMTTNEKYAVPTNMDDERFCICDVSPVMKGDRDYFTRLLEATGEESVMAAFLAAMLDRDISDFIPANIPLTTGLKEQRRFSLSTTWTWFIDVLETGYVSDDLTFSDELPARALYESYIRWCQDTRQGKYDIQNKTAFGLELGTVFDKQRRGYGVVYRFGSAAQAKALLSEKLGI